DELNVKEVEVAAQATDIAEFSLRPNLPVLGKRAGKAIPAIQRALAADSARVYADLQQAGSAVLAIDGAEFTLTDEDVIASVAGKGGLFAASSGSVVVAIDPQVTPLLREEWYVREVAHFVQGCRKDQGLAVSDHIRLRLTCTDQGTAAALSHASADLAREVLADTIEMVTGIIPGGAATLDLDGGQVGCQILR
ncbi:MAG TPA: DUF5915 domain-containing protein, partial [Candidatus Cryosericum sp.]